MFLEYIHGGEEASLLGAWDLIAANAQKELMDNLIGKYKRGKYLEGIASDVMKGLSQSEGSMTQAISFKYENFLSRRKYNLLCKTQSTVFDANNELWIPRNVKCLGLDMQVSLSKVSDESVEKFVKTLDIGSVSQIPNVPGVTRTVTGLVFMIVDLHLRLPHLCRRLVWFNGNTNHFIFQFSDDGAPETSQLTMSIGSMTFWNLGERVRSREFQYLLHCVSLGEKHEVLESLWQQHTDEMLLLESSVFTVCQRECTFQFQPSADMSWQNWGCNEVNNAATYPSPYANVHKGNMCTMGGSIGFNDNLWQPYTCDIREKHLDMVNTYIATLPKKLSDKAMHAKKLSFMADNGIRQLGKPRIGIFADRVKPDPLHCEINAWQHLLDLIYSEALRRGLFDKFIETLSAPVGLDVSESVWNDTAIGHSIPLAGSTSINGVVFPGSGVLGLSSADNEDVLLGNPSSDIADIAKVSPEITRQFSVLDLQKQTAADNMSTMLRNASSAVSNKTCTGNSSLYGHGCGLAYLRSKLEEHYSDEGKRFNKLSIRLIGRQAIVLARHCYRLVDCLESETETEGEKLKRLALSKIAEYLRNAGGLFNKIHVQCLGEIDQLDEFCQHYFNMLALFFPESINVTVWTVAYAIPYHARKLYDQYGIGFGILSLQAKESKHAGLKAELSLTNRSRKCDNNGKWWQIMRANYVRSFYLPEHQPSPSSYASHFQSRKPPHCDEPFYCDCGRKKATVQHTHCSVCLDARHLVECTQHQKLSSEVVTILKPISCSTCNQRFPDTAGLEVHTNAAHTNTFQSVVTSVGNLKSLTVEQLKNHLRAKGLSTSGKKDVLIRRLEGALSADS